MPGASRRRIDLEHSPGGSTAAPERQDSARPVLVPVPPLAEARIAGGERIPSPEPGFVRALAVQGFEVIEGSRTLAQLGPLITVGLARSLSAQRAGAGDRRVVCRDARRARPRPTTVRIDRPVAHIAEAAIVLRVGDVARAVALRLEWAHQHWRATEFFLL